MVLKPIPGGQRKKIFISLENAYLDETECSTTADEQHCRGGRAPVPETSNKRAAEWRCLRCGQPGVQARAPTLPRGPPWSSTAPARVLKGRNAPQMPAAMPPWPPELQPSRPALSSHLSPGTRQTSCLGSGLRSPEQTHSADRTEHVSKYRDPPFPLCFLPVSTKK